MSTESLDSAMWRYHMLGAKGDDRTHDWLVLERDHAALLVALEEARAERDAYFPKLNDLNDDLLTLERRAEAAESALAETEKAHAAGLDALPPEWRSVYMIAFRLAAPVPLGDPS